jgi:hypothetical protein
MESQDPGPFTGIILPFFYGNVDVDMQQVSRRETGSIQTLSSSG